MARLESRMEVLLRQIPKRVSCGGRLLILTHHQYDNGLIQRNEFYHCRTSTHHRTSSGNRGYGAADSGSHQLEHHFMSAGFDHYSRFNLGTSK
jgi:hypothetical protein